jgi:hypothetical protein
LLRLQRFIAAKRNYIGQRSVRSARQPALIEFAKEAIPVPHPLLFLISTSLTVELSMKNRTETLEIGSRAPDFSLEAANREGTFTLSGLLAQDKLILEFLRGTW